MKPTIRLRSFLAAACSSLLAVSSATAQATSGTWNTDAAGNWTNILNWLGDTAYAEGADNTATFGDFIGADRIITLDTGITIGNITASDTTHNYTISGANILTLDRTDATAPTIDVTTSGRTLTISSEISGSDGLTKIGAGTLVLRRDSGSNTYTGTTTLSAGILQANTGTSLIASIANPLGTSGLQLNGGTLQLRSDNAASGAGADTIAWNNNTTVGGNVTINVDRIGGSGSNKIHQLGTLSIGAHTLTASDASNANHDLRFGATTLTGNAVFNVTNGGGSTNLTLGAVGESGGARSVTKTGAATLTLSSANTYTGGTFISGGDLTINSSASLGAVGSRNLTFTGSATLNTTGTPSLNVLTVDSGATATISNNTVTFTSTTGSGNITFTGGNNSTQILNLGNASAFTGNLQNNIGGTGNPGTKAIQFSSLGDGAGSRMRFGGGDGNSSQSSRYLFTGGSAPLIMNNRQVELLAKPGAGSSFDRALLQNDNSSAANKWVINTNLINTTDRAHAFELRGTNIGENEFAGTIINSTNGGHALRLNKVDGGRWILSGTNTYTGATTISGGTLQVSTLAAGGANSNIGASTNAAGNLILNGGTLRYTGAAVSTDRLFSLQTSSTIDASGTGAVNFTNTGAMGFNTGAAAKTLTLTGTNTGNNTIAAAIGDLTLATSIAKNGIGTWVLSGQNTNTGATTISGGGNLILDYGTQDNNKIAGILTLNNGGGSITLRGGSHLEAVTSTTMTTGGGHTHISREVGSTAKLALGVITRSQSGGTTMSLAADSLATTTSTVVNGILGGGITVGSNWAKVSAGDIVALAPGDYSTLTAAATTGTVNYQLTGSLSRAAASINSLRIVGDGSDQVLTITSGNLTPSAVGAPFGNTGGILYAGGGNDNYTITGPGAIQAQNGNQDLIIHTHTGTLTVDMAVTTGNGNGGGSALTKAGAGTLILTQAGTYTGLTFVNQGVLQLRNSAAAGTTGAITVHNAAALELANSVAIGNKALTITGAGVSNGGALRNVASNTSSYAGAITIGNGGARINSDATGINLLTLTGGVVTSQFNDVTFGGAGNTTVSTAAISGAGGLIKDGAGTTTLSATNTYTGTTTVTGGTLLVNGNISTSITTVQTGATLGGSGSVGALTVNSGGFHTPGTSPGIQNTGNYSNAGTLGIEIDGATVGTGYDQVNTIGTVTLSGQLSITMGYTPAANELFFILANDSTDAITGTFSNASVDGNTYTLGGQQFQISYFGNQTSPGGGTFTGGNDIVLMAIPEPNVAALLGALGAILLLRRRR